MAKGKKESTPFAYDYDHAEIRFFDNKRSWCTFVVHKYGLVHFEMDEAGVHRAYVKKEKVGVFGSLPGHGFVVSLAWAGLFKRKKRKLHVETHEERMY